MTVSALEMSTDGKLNVEGEEDEEYDDEEEDDESEEESYSGTDEDESDEPLLKYKRFAKEVVNDLNSTQGETKNVIECMAVHSKVWQFFSSIACINIVCNSLLHWEHLMVV